MMSCSARPRRGMEWRGTRARVALTRAVRASSVAAVLALGACDFPTEPPKFRTRFVVPAESTTLSVNQLLPSSISVVGTNFRLAIGAQPIPPRTLAEMCGAACAPFPTVFTAPKPGFIDSIAVALELPADVSSATLAGGTVTVALTHSFSFDPLRPPGGANGSITLRVRNGTRELATATITDPFPPNTTLSRTLPLAAGEVTGPLDVVIVLNSPPGSVTQPVVIDKNATLSGSVTPNAIDISSARVTVNNKAVSVQAVRIDLTGFEDMRERVKGGALVVNMTNPLSVTGTLTLTLSGGSAGPITKSVVLAAGATSQRVEFTEAELQSLLGRQIDVTITGPVSGTAGGVTVTPGQQVSITTLLDLIFELGAGDDNT